jgi:hypothetical protein
MGCNRWRHLTECEVGATWAADEYDRARHQIAQFMQYADARDDCAARMMALFELTLIDLQQCDYTAARNHAQRAWLSPAHRACRRTLFCSSRSMAM